MIPGVIAAGFSEAAAGAAFAAAFFATGAAGAVAAAAAFAAFLATGAAGAGAGAAAAFAGAAFLAAAFLATGAGAVAALAAGLVVADFALMVCVLVFGFGDALLRALDEISEVMNSYQGLFAIVCNFLTAALSVVLLSVNLDDERCLGRAIHFLAVSTERDEKVAKFVDAAFTEVHGIGFD